MTIAIIAIIAAFAIPRLLRARMSASEAAAIASLKAVGTAEIVYARTCGDGGFAVSLPVLGVAPPGSTAGFLSPDLTAAVNPVKSGYVFALGSSIAGVAGPNDCSGTPTETAYYASAVPSAFTVSGSRSFATSGLPIIWEIGAAAAPTEPYGPPARPVQ